MKKNTYTVSAGRSLGHDGEIFKEGASVELSIEHAEPLIVAGVLVVSESVSASDEADQDEPQKPAQKATAKGSKK